MNARRIIAAAISTIALIAVNVGAADSASARGSHWGFDGKTSHQTSDGSHWD
ncbi:MAG: hypothetical protein ACRDOJ_14630 [Nocardioidaceae bacterium]